MASASDGREPQGVSTDAGDAEAQLLKVLEKANAEILAVCGRATFHSQPRG